MTAQARGGMWKGDVRALMREWMAGEGHGVQGPLERRWREDGHRRVVEGGDIHACIYLSVGGMPAVAVALVPPWADRVHPSYRELMFRDIWRQYDRYQARELRGEAIHQPGDNEEDWP